MTQQLTDSNDDLVGLIRLSSAEDALVLEHAGSGETLTISDGGTLEVADSPHGSADHDADVVHDDDDATLGGVTTTTLNGAEYVVVGEGRALQSAINAAPVGGTVVLAGDELDPGEVTIPADRRLTIEALGERVTLSGDGTGTCITVESGDYVALRNVHVDDYATAVALDAGTHGDVRIEDCEVTNCDDGVDGNDATAIESAAITGSVFDTITNIGVRMRTGDTSGVAITDCTFTGTGFRGVVLGENGGDGGGNAVERCTFEDITNDGDENIGVLTYTRDTVIEHCEFRNITNDTRAEAIYVRGENTTVRSNTCVDAGGDVGSIICAGSNGPTTVVDNYVEFTDSFSGGRDAVDSRQSGTSIHDNEFRGFAVGIALRRGGKSQITDNVFRDSDDAEHGIDVTISTGMTIPEENMGRVTVTGNHVYGIDAPGSFEAVYVNPDSHGGSADVALDDLVISGNTMTGVSASGDATGVYFDSLDQSGSHARRVVLTDNVIAGFDDGFGGTYSEISGDAVTVEANNVID